MGDLVHDEGLFLAMASLVDKSYVEQARQVLSGRSAKVRRLVEERKLPEVGWEEDEIVSFLGVLASMDSNNFSANVGVGEREARVVSPLVRRLHCGLAHGVGRSGDIAAVQPKAAGSSLLSKLANALALDALQKAGLVEMRAALVVPCATGLSLALCLLALRAGLDGVAPHEKRTVVWLRIDQKSCLKGIALAGMRVVVVEPTRSRSRGSAPRSHRRKTEPATGTPDLGDELRTDLSAVEAALSSEDVLCVVTTSSCFAPRAPDDIEGVARVCSRAGVAHVVNNAYGVQCAQTCAAISRAQRVGRVDLVVQSTDKNFLVPVGGAVVASADPDLVSKCVAKSYPGRASATPARDLLVTLLGLGRTGWTRLLADREALLPRFRETLEAVAVRHGERLLDCEHNRVSVGVSLATVDPDLATKFGSMLFTRCCSGTRVVAPDTTAKFVAGLPLVGFGASAPDYPIPYLTAACALGLEPRELDDFAKRLDKTFAHIHKLMRKRHPLVTPTATSTSEMTCAEDYPDALSPP
ncbi:hypothetical protein CTAYLR_004690 [Chrysophaeum taylorii]|uniref:O-phosphoseryl-tRNA(Sec) selenium transferase n=1 Tax=Chrysophaeum taylorii TaxID=2483200 RepID=A0AAD7U923_9STRA|nr:hypothetical protein CTAYLR_004690 [Chrysophaeum taylorii]